MQVECPRKLRSGVYVQQAFDRRLPDAQWEKACVYRSLALPGEAPLDHNFRYPRVRELTLDNDAIALGGCSRTF